MPAPGPEPLITVRAMVVLLTAVLVGLIAGGLGYMAYGDAPTAALVGGGATGAALALINSLLSR